MKVKKGKCKIIIEADKMEIANSEPNYTEDICFGLFKVT